MDHDGNLVTLTLAEIRAQVLLRRHLFRHQTVPPRRRDPEGMAEA
jgi:hypothetical protein